MSGAGEIRFRRLPAATRSSSIDGLIEIFRTTPLAGLMAVVTLGYLLGRWQVRGLALGPAAGTLIVGLGAGYFGLSLADIYGDWIESPQGVSPRSISQQPKLSACFRPPAFRNSWLRW